MKRRVYATARERKIDQIIGFAAFPVVNVTVWFVTKWLLGWAIDAYHARFYSSHEHYFLVRSLISSLPWVVNGAILATTFLFRPHVGIGYVAFTAIALTTVIALGGLFLGACFLSVAVTAFGASLGVSFLGALLAFWLFFSLLVGGLYFLGRKTANYVTNWWPQNKNERHKSGSRNE